MNNNLLNFVLFIALVMFPVSLWFLVEATMNKEPLPLEYSVEVVGAYKECEILQYTNSNLANHHYLLYCGDQK